MFRDGGMLRTKCLLKTLRGDDVEHKLIICKDFWNILDNVDASVRASWNKHGYTSSDDLLSNVIQRLNMYNSNMNVVGYDVRDDLSVYGSSCNYLAIVETKDEPFITKAYVFFTIPTLGAKGSRSAYLEQQCFPVISGIMDHCIESSDYHLVNRPVYIINVNVDNMTPSMALSYHSAELVGFNMIDMINNNVHEILLTVGYDSNKASIETFDKVLSDINRNRKNTFFEVDVNGKVIRYLDEKFKDSNTGIINTSITNQPYWFMLKALAVAYLANKKEYKFDLLLLNAVKANKSLDAFKKYIFKIGG